MVLHRLASVPSRRGPTKDYELLRDEIRKSLMQIGNGRVSVQELRETIRSIGGWSAAHINRNGDMELSRAELRGWLLQGLRGEQKPTMSTWRNDRRSDPNRVIDEHEMKKLVEYAGKHLGLRFVD